MKKNKIKYLQIESSMVDFVRPLETIEDVRDWYQHLVLNPRRDRPFHLKQRYPRFSKKNPEYCVLDLENNSFLSKKDM